MHRQCLSIIVIIVLAKDRINELIYSPKHWVPVCIALKVHLMMLSINGTLFPLYTTVIPEDTSVSLAKGCAECQK